MNDTPPQIILQMQEMILKKKPEERLAMGCSMFDFSKALVRNAVLREAPGLSETEMKRQIFLRFYGVDFDSAQKEKILEHLSRS